MQENTSVMSNPNHTLEVPSDWVTETAELSSIEGDALVLSVAAPQSACGGCTAKSHCGQSAMTSALALFTRQSPSHTLRISRANFSGGLPNTPSPSMDLKLGDTVVVGLPKHRLVQATLLMYVLPLLGAVLGALIGHVCASPWAVSSAANDLFGVIGALVGVLFVVLGLRQWGRHPVAQRAFEPTILKKI